MPFSRLRNSKNYIAEYINEEIKQKKTYKEKKSSDYSVTQHGVAVSGTEHSDTFDSPSSSVAQESLNCQYLLVTEVLRSHPVSQNW
jgi:hypothetical protein